MEIDYTKIGQRIKFARTQAGLSQEVLAQKADISVVHLSNIENGHTKMSLPTIIAIANALNVSVDEFLGDNLHCFKSEIDEELRDLMIDCSPLERQYILEVAKDSKKRFRKYFKG